MYCRIPELSREGRKRAAALARQHASRKEQLRAKVRDQAATAIAAGPRAASARSRSTTSTATASTTPPSSPRSAAPTCHATATASARSSARSRAKSRPGWRSCWRSCSGAWSRLASRSARRGGSRCGARVDSIPLTRRSVLDVLKDGETLSTSEVARRVDADRKVVRFALEELELLGAVSSPAPRQGRAVRGRSPDAREVRPRDWWLCGDDGKMIARVFGEVGRNVESLSPSPPSNTQGGYGSSHPKPRAATGDSGGAA